MNTRALTEDSSYLIGKYLNCESPYANEILDPIFGLQETYKFSKRQRNIFYLITFYIQDLSSRSIRTEFEDFRRPKSNKDKLEIAISPVGDPLKGLFRINECIH